MCSMIEISPEQWEVRTLTFDRGLQSIVRAVRGNDNRAFQSVVFNSGQKMALRVFYFIRTLAKALTYYYTNRSQWHLLVAIENRARGQKELSWNDLGESFKREALELYEYEKISQKEKNLHLWELQISNITLNQSGILKCVKMNLTWIILS